MVTWTGKTIGPALGYKIFSFVIHIFGIAPAYFLVYIVSYYYFLFGKDSRATLQEFYQQCLRISSKEALKICRKNYLLLGQSMIDRFVINSTTSTKYTFTFENEIALKNIAQENKGGIFLSAHLGNWETAGALLKNRITNKLHVVMLDAESQAVKKVLAKKNSEAKFEIIPIQNDLSHIIKIKNALDNKDIIAMHADRVYQNGKALSVNFCGKSLHLPKGPFQIAAKCKVPLSFVYAIKASRTHYNLSATNPILPSVNNTPESIAQQ